ncbi:hypothetical protein [Cohnella sp. GCM10027633]|uniref:hypothetical protein n=1 Tax=unclassified Cohnella TaxID=2636738 RepID=UPI00362E9028
MKKSVYKSAMSRVETSKDFEEATYRKLLREMNKTQDQTFKSKERINMTQVKKSKRIGLAIGIAACAAALSIGIFNMNQNTSNTASPEPSVSASAPATTTPSPSISAPESSAPAQTTRPPVTGKVQVNIDGVISEVSADGKSFKVGDLWVTVTPETIMGIDGPTAGEQSEELLQKEFKVGNIVSGFTSEDMSTGKVNATRIYNNMAPQQ